MARAKLLRQYVQDYQNKVAGVNEQIEAANAAYESAYGQYANQVNAYNAWVDSVKAGADRGYFQLQDGRWQYMTGRDGNLQPIAPGGKVGPLTFDRYESVDAAKATGMRSGNYIVRNPDGTATPYQVSMMRGNPDPVHTALAQNYAAPARIGEFTGQAPAEPVAPESPRAPNFTRSEIAEMQNPGLTQAQLALTRAQGFEGKSELKGDELAGANSAFADPDDPNNLKEKGILARVMGGEL